MAEARLKVEGMSCGHCVMRVKKALDSLAGVSAAKVDIGEVAVTYDESKAKESDITAAIEKAGYKVVR